MALGVTAIRRTRVTGRTMSHNAIMSSLRTLWYNLDFKHRCKCSLTRSSGSQFSPSSSFRDYFWSSNSWGPSRRLPANRNDGLFSFLSRGCSHTGHALAPNFHTHTLCYTSTRQEQFKQERSWTKHEDLKGWYMVEQWAQQEPTFRQEALTKTSAPV